MFFEDKRDMERTLAQGKPVVCVGKNGVSPELLKEIEKRLKKDKVVKVKILKSALAHDEAKLVASRIAEQTEVSLIGVRGYTFTLCKPDKK